MVDRLFSDAALVELYDVLCPWEQRGDLDFYLELVMSAKAVLDVGCGTGALLHRAREIGHAGRLCGLDPANAMLDVARTRSDIEWIHGDLDAVAPTRRRRRGTRDRRPPSPTPAAALPASSWGPFALP